MESLYSLQNIVCAYASKTVLTIDHLEVFSGRITCLTGVNGSGKSSLLELLGLLHPPVKGELCYRGKPLPRSGKALQQIRLEITLAHQTPYLLKGTVADNIRYPLKLRNLTQREQDRLICWSLQTVGLGGFEQRKSDQLSGGELRRVAIARALALKPRVLLLDEPMAGLDTAQSDVMESILTRLSAADLTVILSTHDPALPARLCADVVHLQEGQLAGRYPLPTTPETPLCPDRLKMQEA